MCCGEQSGPNNEGVRRATGGLIAFLNHDDLWFPDHLERTVATLQETDADMVFALTDRMRGDGTRKGDGVFVDRKYSPFDQTLVGCSSWLVRRETAASVGPWRSFRELQTFPSRDWLFRAWSVGKDIRVSPSVTVIAISGGSRPGCYTNRDDAEHLDVVDHMRRDPEFRERELTELLFIQRRSFREDGLNYLASIPYGKLCRAMVHITWKRVLGVCGIDPKAYSRWRQGKHRSEHINRLRKVRGLHELPTKAIDLRGKH